MMEYACGILRLLLAGNALRPLEIHKVFLRVRAFFRLKIRAQSALGDPIIACFYFFESGTVRLLREIPGFDVDLEQVLSRDGVVDAPCRPLAGQGAVPDWN